MLAAKLVEAVRMAVLVFALILLTFELEAFRIFVLAAAKVEPSEELALSVLALAVARVEPRELDAAFVLALIEVMAPET